MVWDKKKGQVTVFVILGLIVFVLVFIAFFLLFDEVEPDPTDALVTEFDARLSPLVLDVNYCVGSLTKEALIRVGLQGGYIDVSQFQHGLVPEYLNTALEFFPGSNQVIPYWYYSPNNPGGDSVSLIMGVPSLESGPNSVKAQVEDYIESNIVDCLNDFSNYASLYSISYSEPFANVLFRMDDVFVELDWGLEVEFFEDDTVAKLNKFNDVVDLEFRKTFDFAKQLLYESQLYSDASFLEEYTIKVLELMSMGGKNAVIPPISRYSEHTVSSPAIWNLFESKELLRTELADNSGFLQVMGAYDSFIPLTNDPYANLIYSSFIFPPFDIDADKLERTRVSFDYMPSWPMYLNIKPGFGPVITAVPKLQISMLGLFNFAMTDYEFFYDIAYPVLVTVEDPFSFNDEGYIFRFVVEVNVRQNEFLLTDFEEIVYDSYELEDDFGGFGYPDQRTIPVKVIVRNGYDESPVEDFALAYTCLDVTIPVGNSKMKDGSAVIEGFLPPCFGGEFHSLTGNYQVSYDSDLTVEESYEFILEVYPEKEIIIRPRKKSYFVNNVEINELEDAEKRTWSLDLAMEDGRVLEENEILTVMLIMKDNPGFVRIFNLSYPETEIKTSLLPGNYEVILVSERVLGANEQNPVLLVPEKTYSISSGFFRDLFKGEEEVTFNETAFNDSVVIGGLFINEPDFFSINVEDLKYNNFLYLYYPSYNIKDVRYHHDLTIMGKVVEMEEEHKELFVPKFER